MKLNISEKIILIAATGVVVSSIIILCIGSIMTSRLFNHTLHNDMLSMQALVANMLNEEEKQLRQVIQMLVTRHDFVDALHKKDVVGIRKNVEMIKSLFEFDVITVTNAQGIVLARGHSVRVQDDISGRPTMVAALNGEIVAGVFYDTNAEVPFSIRSFAPIYKNGVLVGTLSIGTNVASQEYVDNLYNITNMNFSIYYGNTRYMTSFIDEDGTRIIGTTYANKQITDRVLNRGEIVIDRSVISGEPSMVAIWPMTEIDSGRIIGKWSLAMSVASQNSGIKSVYMIISFCSLCVMVFIALFASLLGHKITGPIRKVTDYAVHVADGTFDAPLNLNSRDEVGRLAGALETMVATLKERIREAEAANNAKSSFLSTMSHEIRTPMNTILGVTEIQLQNESLEPELKESFDMIFTSGYLLLGIINDLLDLSKIEAGKLELVNAKYEIASLISDTAQQNMMRIGSKPIEFELIIDENMPAVLLGDELRVKQILNNILSNAFKYTQNGTVKMSVSTTGICDTDVGNNDEVILIVSISDTGQGMTKEQVDKLFDEYARFNREANRTTEGTGLGMSITQNLVSLMNGEILVESEPDKGSVFTVRLPQNKVGVEVLGKEMVENLCQFRTSIRTQLKRVQISYESMPYGSVLIVDDVNTNIYVAKGLMLPYELKIDTADSGFAAIEKIKEGKVYDVIFMDHMMPKMDGIETTKHLRDLGYANPIVALTANAVAGQTDMFIKNGFNDFISKPIDIRQMNAVMNKFVRDKQPPEVIEASRRKKNRNTKPIKGSGIHPQADTYNEATSILLGMNKKILGLDIVKGLERYNGDEDVYLKILHSYSIDVRSMLSCIDTVNEDRLAEYKVKVHGIKGASFDIYAEQIGNDAEKLEEAAKVRDLGYIEKHNASFVEAVREFIDNIDDMLLAVNAEKPKKDFPLKDKINDESVSKLIAACKMYNMNEIDEAMAEIEKYRYESDSELVDWLRKNVDKMNYTQIVEKFSLKSDI